MSHDPSRKYFLAKLIGLAAVAGLAPKLLAKSPVDRATPASPAAINLRPESRAIARRPGQA